MSQKRWPNTRLSCCDADLESSTLLSGMRVVKIVSLGQIKIELLAELSNPLLAASNGWPEAVEIPTRQG